MEMLDSMEWLFCGMRSVIDCIVSCVCSILHFLFKESTGDVMLWALAFTMNTWATTLDRARKRLIESTRKAVEKSRMTVKQARLVEALWICRRSNPKGSKKFLRDASAYLSKLDKWKVQDERIKAGEVIEGLPEYILSICALFSALCIIFGWLYNITLIVLLPFPFLMCRYTGQGYFRVRYIKRKQIELLLRATKELSRSYDILEFKRREYEQFEKDQKIINQLRRKLMEQSP